MALRPPNMEDCRPKCKCKSGPNAGKVYDPTQPCFPGETFDAGACDCSTGAGWDSLAAYWQMQYTGTGKFAGNTGRWTAPGWYNGYQSWRAPSGSRRNQYYLDSAAFVSTTGCCPGPSTYGDRSGVFSIKYKLSSSSLGLVEPIVYRGRCIWPEDCGYRSYCKAKKDETPGEDGCLTYNVYGRFIATRLEPDPSTPSGWRRDTYVLFNNIPADAPGWRPNEPDWIIQPGPITAFHNDSCACSFSYD